MKWNIFSRIDSIETKLTEQERQLKADLLIMQIDITRMRNQIDALCKQIISGTELDEKVLRDAEIGRKRREYANKYNPIYKERIKQKEKDAAKVEKRRAWARAYYHRTKKLKGTEK
jgi:hypothetical protein